MFGNGMDLSKLLGMTKGLDISGIANKIIDLVPDGKGKKAANLALGVAKNGGSPKDVKKALEDMLSPEDKKKLKGIDIWNNIPDDKDSVTSYGTNVAKQFGILK